MTGKIQSQILVIAQQVLLPAEQFTQALNNHLNKLNALLQSLKSEMFLEKVIIGLSFFKAILKFEISLDRSKFIKNTESVCLKTHFNIILDSL